MNFPILPIPSRSHAHSIQFRSLDNPHIFLIQNEFIPQRCNYFTCIFSQSLYSITTFHRLFSLYSHSSTYSFFSCFYDQSFNNQFLIVKIREFLLHVDISSFGFSDHFIRRDAAVTAALNDISRDDIKLLER